MLLKSAYFFNLTDRVYKNFDPFIKKASYLYPIKIILSIFFFKRCLSPKYLKRTIGTSLSQ